jgi:peptidyl-prolyl cis-trans isomerase D
MFGAQYQQLVQQFGLNIGQNVLDGLVDSTLLSQVAQQKGFAASDNEVLETIQKQFPGGYNRDALAASGMTPEQFLKETEQQVMLEQISTILRQASIPSKKEVEAQYLKEETQYELESIAFTPKKFEASVANPSDEDLKSYFDSRSSEFQTKPSVAFSYVSFDPEKYFPQVEVPQEEIDFYYTENQKEFETPESVTAKHIQVLFPKENDPKKLAEAREKAQEVLGKAKAGENFESLVKQYSDDMTTKFTGGLLGSVPKGKYKGAFDQKVFALKSPGVADLVETEFGFQIVKVESFSEATIKSIEDVRNDIIKKLKNEQAPAIADAAAREFFSNFLASDKSLEEFASQNNIAVIKQSKLVTESEVVTGTPKDFTKKIIESLPEVKQIIEDKKTSYIVEVTQSEESKVPELSEIKAFVLAAYKKNKSFEVAKKSSDEVLTLIKNGKSLSDAANTVALSVDKTTEVKRGQRNAPLISEEAEELVLSADLLPSIPQQTFSDGNGTYYIARSISKKVPEISSAKPEDLQKTRENLNQELAQNLRKEILDSLKIKTKIDIDTSVLAAS